MSFLLLLPILVPVAAGLVLLLVPKMDSKLPRTALTIAALAATVLLLIPVLAALALPPVILQTLGFLYVVLGISGPVYGASFILRDIFD